MKTLIIFAVIFLSAVTILAYDPGIPDTVIVGTVYIDFGEPYVDVPVYAVTDEDVFFYNTPITWSINADGIEPSEVYYYHPLEHWDEVYDSVLVDEHFIRMVGWVADFFYLNTGGLRWRCLEIRFTVDSLAPPQFVVVDSTHDPINGSILFGEYGGMNSFTPQFVSGGIYYGIQSEVNEDNQIFPSDIGFLHIFPNPFNTSATIEFTLPEKADVELSVYNILGQKIVTLFDGRSPAGDYSLTWNAVDFPSGIYFARLEANLYSQNIKMLMLK